MIEVQDKRVLVVGLARSGRAAARILRGKGAVVTVSDSRPPAFFQAEIPELTSLKIGLELGVHREATFVNQDLIVVSPGVPWELSYLESARRQRIPIIPEIELASWFLEGSLVGVTGTNGKTTTTSLLGKMLQSSDLPTFVGGNIGVPLISAVGQTHRNSVLVAELSSFQLEGIQTFRPHVAVLLNLSPNHLDRHRSFESYVGAKARIFHNQSPGDYAILNADDPNVMSLAPAITSRKIFFSRQQSLPDGIFAANGHIVYRVGNLERILLEKSDVRLRGDFNVEDVLAASAAACVVGADFEAVRQSVRDFRGVEHRLEFVREIHGVEYYNDSKATSVDATAKALTAFDHGVHLILGGKDKGAPYTPLRPLLKDRVREALLIGAAADKIAQDLEGAVELVRAGDLETAARHAFRLAVPGDVVLLAPACASFDQFKDFEQRGQVFKDLVDRLAQEAAIADSVKQVEIVAPAAAPRDEQPPSPRVREAEPVPESTGAPVEESTTVPPVVPARDQTAAAPEGKRVAALAASKPELLTEMSQPAASVSVVQASPPTPKSESRTPKPELVYVFEVSAEERVPISEEQPGTAAAEDLEVISTEDMSALESVSDEALPFEVTAKVHAESQAQPKTGAAVQSKQRIALSEVKAAQQSLFAHTKDPEQEPGG